MGCVIYDNYRHLVLIVMTTGKVQNSKEFETISIIVTIYNIQF